MKKVFGIVAFMLMFQGVGSANDTEMAISIITNAMPLGWKVAYITPTNSTYWSRSRDMCIELQLYGLHLRGFAFYDSYDVKGNLIGESRYINEGILVWVTPEGFRLGWNKLSRLANWFSVNAIDMPDRIDHHPNIHVYAIDSPYVTPENARLNQKSQKGTRSAYPIPPTNGYSWVTWKADLTAALEKDFEQPK